MRVEYVPFTLQLDEKAFTDDDTLHIPDYITQMKRAKSVRTAAPSPELYLEKMKGDEPCFVITISSPLSASYSNALLARQMYIDEYGEKFIHVFDSHSASVGPALIAFKINEFIKQNLNPAEIVAGVNKFIEGLHTYFVLESYDNLVKNGRINGYVAKVASVLNIKPICAEVNGKLAMIDKARGINKAMKKIVDILTKNRFDEERSVLAISHVKCLDKAQWLRDEIVKILNFKEIIILETKGLCTTYADDGGIIISC
jgi:DegV family protein with EDD domain